MDFRLQGPLEARNERRPCFESRGELEVDGIAGSFVTEVVRLLDAGLLAVAGL
jgi:hypothetical protein